MADWIGRFFTLGLLIGALAVCWRNALEIWDERDEGEPPEPDAVDGVELSNVIDLRVQGGLRSARARALELERRAALREPA